LRYSSPIHEIAGDFQLGGASVMRVLTTVILGILIFVAPARATEVTFASFNVFWLYDDKKPHIKWWNDKRGAMGQTYQQALEAVAQTIVKTNADVIGLQEIEGPSITRDLQKKLNELGVNYPHFWTGKGSDPTGQDVALLSKFSAEGSPRLEFSSEREIYWTDQSPVTKEDEKDTSISKGMRVDLKIETDVVPVFVFHLKSQRGGAASDQQRVGQASIVRRVTLPLILKKQKFVVMGDMNADRSSASLRRLRGLDDVQADLYQPTFLDKFTGEKWTYIFRGRTEQIDHILVSPALRTSLKSGKVIYGHDRSVSDHAPIVVRLKF